MCRWSRNFSAHLSPIIQRSALRSNKSRPLRSRQHLKKAAWMLGCLTRHSPNLRYERLCTDQFALIVAENHPWANRRVLDLSKLHQQRLLQLPDSFVMRRMSDEICRKHQVRPHVIAEINAIETLLRSLGPLKAAALMPKIALRGRANLKLKAIRLCGKNLGLDIGLLRLSDSAANSAVAAFTSLAKATVPRMIKPYTFLPGI